MRVNSCPNRGPAQRPLTKMFLESDQTSDGMLDLAGIAAEFLAEPDGSCVLQVRAANFYYGIKFLRLFVQTRVQLSNGRDQLMHDSIQRCDVNRRWNHVI